MSWGAPLRAQTYVVEHDQAIGPTTVVAADCMKDAVAHHGGEKLLNEECQKSTADDGQVEVVNHEGSIKDERFAVLHKFSPAENYNIV